MRQQTTLNSKNQKKPVSRKAVKNSKSKKAKTSPTNAKSQKASKSKAKMDGGMPTFAPVDPSQRLSPRDQDSPVHDHERVH